jgi:hypothetical protein
MRKLQGDVGRMGVGSVRRAAGGLDATSVHGPDAFEEGEL